MWKIIAILVIFHHGVSCAMRKSWKSAANFDDEVPKFTPFENVGGEVKDVKEGRDIKTTETVTQPSPSAETLKISSKFKMPGKVAKIYKEEPKEGFGKFAYEVPEESAEEKSSDDEKDENDFNNEEVLKNLEIKHDEEEDEEGYEITSFDANDNSSHYNIAKFVNVTIDEEDRSVNVNLDQNTLKEIFSGSYSKFY